MCLGSWLSFGRLNRVLGLDTACVLPSHYSKRETAGTSARLDDQGGAQVDQDVLAVRAQVALVVGQQVVAVARTRRRGTARRWPRPAPGRRRTVRGCRRQRARPARAGRVPGRPARGRRGSCPPTCRARTGRPSRRPRHRAATAITVCEPPIEDPTSTTARRRAPRGRTRPRRRPGPRAGWPRLRALRPAVPAHVDRHRRKPGGRRLGREPAPAAQPQEAGLVQQHQHRAVARRRRTNVRAARSASPSPSSASGRVGVVRDHRRAVLVDRHRAAVLRVAASSAAASAVARQPASSRRRSGQQRHSASASQQRHGGRRSGRLPRDRRALTGLAACRTRGPGSAPATARAGSRPRPRRTPSPAAGAGRRRRRRPRRLPPPRRPGPWAPAPGMLGAAHKPGRDAAAAALARRHVRRGVPHHPLQPEGDRRARRCWWPRSRWRSRSWSPRCCTAVGRPLARPSPATPDDSSVVGVRRLARLARARRGAASFGTILVTGMIAHVAGSRRGRPAAHPRRGLGGHPRQALAADRARRSCSGLSVAAADRRLRAALGAGRRRRRRQHRADRDLGAAQRPGVRRACMCGSGCGSTTCRCRR